MLPAAAARAPRGSVSETLLIAALGALVAATWYVGWVGLRYGAMGDIVNVSRDIAWMSPLAYLAFFAVFAIPAAAIARLLPRALARRLAFGCFAALAVFSIGVAYSELAHVAVILLALGAGVAVARAAASRPAAWLHATRPED